jgi:protocatechuate 3,4-dioxygenase beta subunit
MVTVRRVACSLAYLSFAQVAWAHPGETYTEDEIKREVARHEAAQTKAYRSLSECANSPTSLALKARAAERRVQTARALREKRGLSGSPMKSKRDQASLERWNAESHDMSDLRYNLETDVDTIFGSNATCTLVPESTIGPYWVSGELVRTDLTEGEPGVPLHLEMQFVNTGDCGPVPDLVVDLWHANAMGLYSGISSRGQGGPDTNWGRGVQLTDAEGVVEFDTIFPGHYVGRATHIHLMSLQGATLLDNNTYSGGTANHIGQLYFDQSLLEAVTAADPYNTNEQRVTLNQDDWLAANGASADYDPFVDYVYLGDGVSNGLLAWILIGIDTTADQSDGVEAAAFWSGSGNTADGSDADSPTGTGGGGSAVEPSPSSAANRPRILWF